ncbi:hypothetical protein [Peribacillus butanolivorans]|uniref:hypothetical protein n=1 Tax=Peribacillus butanolivorans TaxID=421767 RepID=UPI003647F780
MANKVTANEVLGILNNMDNGERIKLLDKMYDKYYDGGGAVRYNEGNSKSRAFITNPELEIAFLADKINKLEREVFLLKRRDNPDDY